LAGFRAVAERNDRELVPAQTWEPGGGGPSVCCECIRTAAAVAAAALVCRTAGCARTAGQHVPTVIAGHRPQPWPPPPRAHLRLWCYIYFKYVYVYTFL